MPPSPPPAPGRTSRTTCGPQPHAAAAAAGTHTTAPGDTRSDAGRQALRPTPLGAPSRRRVTCPNPGTSGASASRITSGPSRTTGHDGPYRRLPQPSPSVASAAWPDRFLRGLSGILHRLELGPQPLDVVLQPAVVVLRARQVLMEHRRQDPQRLLLPDLRVHLARLQDQRLRAVIRQRRRKLSSLHGAGTRTDLLQRHRIPAVL